MPEIDLLIISHDHYDHLDYATIKALMPKVKRVVTRSASARICATGEWMRRLLMKWTEPDDKISDELTVHALPARHFLRPWAKTQIQTLWASFLFVTPQEKIYYSGDSGYGPHLGLRPLANSLAHRSGNWENGQYDQTGSTST